MTKTVTKVTPEQKLAREQAEKNSKSRSSVELDLENRVKSMDAHLITAAATIDTLTEDRDTTLAKLETTSTERQNALTALKQSTTDLEAMTKERDAALSDLETSEANLTIVTKERDELESAVDDTKLINKPKTKK